MSVKVIGGGHYLRSIQTPDQTKTTSLRTKRAAQPALKKKVHLSRTKKMLSSISARPLKTAEKTKRAAGADLNPKAPKKKKLQSDSASIVVNLDQQVKRLTHNMTMLRAEIPKTFAGRIIQQRLATRTDKIKSLSEKAVSSYESDLAQDGIRPNLAIPRAVRFCEFSSCSSLLWLRQGLKIPDQKSL